MASKKQITVVVGLIKNQQNQILLQKRVDVLIPLADGKWELPGGKINYGESPTEALSRECQEEIACDIKIKRMIPLVQSNIWSRADGGEQQALVICYEAKLINGQAKANDKKVSAVGWFSKEDIDNLDTLIGIKDFIKLL